MLKRLLLTFLLCIILLPIGGAELEIFGENNQRIVEIVTPSSGNVSSNVTNFTQLVDTPSSYTGQGGNCVKVNIGETALEFSACGVGGGGFTTDQNEELNTTGAPTFKNLTINTTGYGFALNGKVLDFFVIAGGSFRFNNGTTPGMIYNTSTNDLDMADGAISNVTNITISNGIFDENTGSSIKLIGGTWQVSG